MFDLDKSGVTEMPDAYIDFKDWLESYTKELVDFTIVRWRSHNYMPDVMARSYIRHLAKSMKRPDIYYSGRESWITLDMPRRKYLEKLIAPLALISKPWNSRSYKGENGVYILPRTTRLIFYFSHQPHLFEQWLLKARTDPEWRKALKLPTE